MFDKFREECGLMGVWNHPEAANLTYLGLYAQQHRGQEGAGVVSYSESQKQFNSHKGLGLVADAFNAYDFSKLPGSYSIGHVRYTTAGHHNLVNTQPFLSEVSLGHVALAHNGNLVNVDELKKELIKDGAIFASSSDTEIFLHLLARGPKNLAPVEVLIESLKRVRGAYSLVLMINNSCLFIHISEPTRPY